MITYASQDIGDDKEHHFADIRCEDHVVGGAVGCTIAAQSRNIFLMSASLSYVASMIIWSTNGISGIVEEGILFLDIIVTMKKLPG